METFDLDKDYQQLYSEPSPAWEDDDTNTFIKSAPEWYKKFIVAAKRLPELSEASHWTEAYSASGAYTSSHNAMISGNSVNIHFSQIFNFAEFAENDIYPFQIEFHPSSSLFFTLSRDNFLRIFHFSKSSLKSLMNIYIKDFSPERFVISPDGTEILVAGSASQFFIYNLISQKSSTIRGVRHLGINLTNLSRFDVSPDRRFVIFVSQNLIHLLDFVTKQHLRALHCNDKPLYTAFTADSRNLLVLCEAGIFLNFDLSDFSQISKNTDTSLFNPASMAVSPDGSILAVGDSAGILTIFSISEFFKNSEKLEKIKIFKNLSTKIDKISFHPSGQILAFSSSEHRNSLRLVNLREMLVFINWPANKADFGRIVDHKFSNDKTTLAVSTGAGRLQFYELLDFVKIN